MNRSIIGKFIITIAITFSVVSCCPAPDSPIRYVTIKSVLAVRPCDTDLYDLDVLIDPPAPCDAGYLAVSIDGTVYHFPFTCSNGVHPGENTSHYILSYRRLPDNHKPTMRESNQGCCPFSPVELQKRVLNRSLPCEFEHSYPRKR